MLLYPLVRSRAAAALLLFAFSTASAVTRVSIAPDTLRTRNLAQSTTFHVIPDTLAPGATLQIDLPWGLIGFDPASPPPPLGPDQLDLYARGAPLQAPARIESQATERAIRIRIVHPGPPLSGGDTLSIVPRFVLSPERPGPQTVDFVLTPALGTPPRALSAPVHVLPSITLAARTSIEPGAPLPIRARADAALAGTYRVVVELDSRRIRLEGPGPLLSGHITAPERPGFYRIRASDPDRLAPPALAVVRVPPNPAAHRIWWADLHGHSDLSDGFGTPEQFYRYARHRSLLDAAALTDHDHLLDDAEWGRVCALADSMERLPGFSAIPAYEWSSRFGDRNVYLPAHHAPIPRRGDPWADHVRELQAWARETGAVLVPHHPASGFRSVDWTLHDPDTEPVCEVYSIHGWAWTDTTTNPLTPRTPAAQRCATPRLAMAVPGRAYDSARALDPALGVIASGDIHTAQPGNLGLAAIRAPSLDRRALLQALRDRHVYGTTGARILLELSADPAPPESPSVHLHALAAAPGELASLTLLKNGVPWIRRDRPGFPAAIDAVDAPSTTTSYQLLAIQTDGERAFSSPIVANPAPA
ncbi:MAG: hypothetical protein CME06_03760, partial [Gemmatimonadetes bacterium]|nr:hypothetical protein [Gemmatimonadota bacterium]